MKKYLSMLLILALSLAMLDAFADSPITAVKGSSTFDVVNDSINGVVGNAIAALQKQAILWLSSFVLIQFLITNLGLLKSGADIEAIIGKLMGSLLWFGFCFYVISEGAGFINKIGGSFLGSTGSLVGGSLDAGNLMDQGIAVGSNLISTIIAVAGFTDFGSVVIAGICAIFVILVMGFIACKVFVMKIELALVVMISPLSFSFLGLNALKDQGIAPFKSLISLMYRTVILCVIISGIDTITQQVTKSIKSLFDNSSMFSQITGMGNGVWPALLGVTTAYLIFGYLAFKSDSIASSLSSGGTNLGSGDVATAAAVGAAAGAAVATGGASLAGGAAKTGQGMTDFMKGLAQVGGSVSNASSSGAGPAPIGSPPSPASMSMGSGGQSASNKPPARSTSGGGVNSANSAAASGAGSSSGSGSNSNQAPRSSGGAGANGNQAPQSPGGSGSNSTTAPRSSGSNGSNGGPTPSADASAMPSLKPSGGSGANAGIDAPLSNLEQQVGDLVNAMNQPKEVKGARDHLSELNQHIAQEQAATHVSISTHNSD